MSQQPLVATWTAHSGSGGTASSLVVTKASTPDKSHYVTGIVASANFWFPGNEGDGYKPEACELTLFSGTPSMSEVIMLQMQFQGETAIVQSSSYQYNALGAGAGPLIINFSAPLMVPVSKQVSLRLDPGGSATSINMDVNILGFTATTRVAFE